MLSLYTTSVLREVVPSCSLDADGCAGTLLATSLEAPMEQGVRSAAQALATILNKASDISNSTVEQLLAKLGG